MKKIYNYLLMIVCLAAICACNDEWKEEQFNQYISFRAPTDSKGCTQINIRYKEGGKTTYRLPVIVSGSTANANNLNIQFAADPDTLAILNIERFNTRTELFYEELPSNFYEFPQNLQIPAGQNVGLLDIDFSLKDLDMVEKWILPITVSDDPSHGYQPNMRKNYRKALLRIMPFNDFSGSYSTNAMTTYFYDAEKKETVGDAMVANARTAFVVSDSTVFFYAGLMDEDLERSKRRLYKIRVKFNKDKSLTLTADNNDIQFEIPEGTTPIYSTTKKMDETLPYIEHRYTTLRLTYLFNDITSAPVPIRYKVTGTLTLEHRVNTQIPDEDQAIEW